MGVIKAICISEKRGTRKQEIKEADVLTDFGIAGDAHAGSWHRQVSLLSYEKIQEFKEKGADVTYGDFGENLIVEGYDFKNLPLGTRFRCGDVVLEMTQIGKECHSHCEIYKRMGDCIMPREGVFAVVISGGVIHKGDDITLIHDNLYRTIADRNPNATALLATITDGESMGEKALWLDGIMRWSNANDTFFKKYCTDILKTGGSGILEIDGRRIFCEKIGSRKNLVICGAGHVSIPIIEIGKKVGFHVTVIDDRPYFADNARRAGADNVVCDNFDAALSAIVGGKDTYFVIVTRGHRYDMDCLRQILEKPNAYIGMMGSKRRVILLKRQLVEDGFEERLIENIHAPIGLAIGAQTPEEIAVSVMAELIQVKNTERKISTYDKELLSYIAGEDINGEYGILCTIVEKRGSAPREIGTKMLILPTGKAIGTIGGGCAESSIIEKARLMLAEDQTKPRIELVDMTAEEAEAEGMVCGGTILVLMEKIGGI